jgi:hypothetical protein
VSGPDPLDVTRRAFSTLEHFLSSTPKYSVVIADSGPTPLIVYMGNAPEAAVAALAAHDAPYPGANITIWDNHAGTQAAFLVWQENAPSPRGDPYSKVGFRFFDADLLLVAQAFQIPLSHPAHLGLARPLAPSLDF